MKENLRMKIGKIGKKLLAGCLFSLAVTPSFARDQNPAAKGWTLASWSKFQYDDKGNLKHAENSENKKVDLIYDTVGRIQVLLDQQHHSQISFEYNESSKPEKITDSKLGSIKVKYNDAGEIENVDGSGGKQVAAQVTAAFQDLLDIVRPAGVTLSF